MSELGPDGKEWAKTAAGYAYVDRLCEKPVGGTGPRFMDGAVPCFVGHHVRDAFVAGAEWQQSRDADAKRYRKLQRYMASNVKPGGWEIVEQLGGVAAWASLDDMDQYLDSLPECNAGLCEVRND